MNRDVIGRQPDMTPRHWVTVLLMASGLTGCTLVPEPQPNRDCSELATVQLPPVQQQRFPLVVQAVNGEVVAGQTTILLAPGSYQLTVAERIDDPRFVRTRAESQSLQLELEAGVRYHLAARLVLDKDGSHWYPEVWRQGEAVCPDLN